MPLCPRHWSKKVRTDGKRSNGSIYGDIDEESERLRGLHLQNTYFGEMRRLKIMQDDSISSSDVFGINDLQDRLKMFCKEQGLDFPLFWMIKPNDYYMGYAVSLHLNGKDRWEEFDTKVIFVLKDFSDRENREVEERLLNHMFEEIGDPIVLTVKEVESPNQLRFLKEIGMMKMPVTWSDSNQNEYAVYAKGNLEMGGFVNLMERVEYIGKEIVYKENDGK